MERESFEDEATAALMNELFVSVKVDREERPDVDAVYMDAVVALTGQGGWPLTVFLTPDGEPFFGGTYFPPEPRHGLPAFRQVLRAVAEAYRERPEDVAAQAEALVGALRRSAATRAVARAAPPRRCSPRRRAVCSPQLDPRWGGFGRAPKFPPASALEFLLRRGSLDAVRLTLDGMAAGGMYDLVGGGFHRYSVDSQWLVPHFEKMLYDNALLVPPYLHAWLRDRRGAIPRRRGADARLPGARAAPRGRRLRLVAGRGHRRRRGADVYVDGGGGSRRPSCCSRSSTAARSCAASWTTRRARGCSRSASSGRSRRSTTR